MTCSANSTHLDNVETRYGTLVMSAAQFQKYVPSVLARATLGEPRAPCRPDQGCEGQWLTKRDRQAGGRRPAPECQGKGNVAPSSAARVLYSD